MLIKMYTALLMLCCFLIFETASGQLTFIKETQMPYDAFFNDMFLTNNGNIIISHADPETDNLSNTCLLKLTEKGKVVWSKKYLFHSTTYNNTIKLISCEDNGIVALNAITYNDSVSGSLLFKTDSSGNIKWAKRLSFNSNKYKAVPESVVAAADGSLYVVSRIYDNGIYIHKFDKNGSPLWHKHIYSDSTINIQTQVGPLGTTPDNGLILSTISFRRYQDKYYSHLFKFTKDGQPSWEYTSNQAFDYYIPLFLIQSGSNGVLRLLYNRYNHFKYMQLNTITGKSDAWDAGKSIFDLQSYLRNQAIHSFNNVSFPVPSYSVYAFTSNWSIIRAYSYPATRTKYRARIEKYDSLGRICPDYKQPELDSSLGKFRFDFTKSSFQVSKPLFELSINDTTITAQSFDIFRTICAGENEPVLATVLTAASNKQNVSIDMRVMPNPAKDYINLFVNMLKPCLLKISITDINGIVIKSAIQNMMKGQNVKNINIADIAAGIYFVKVQTLSGVCTQKIIKL